MDITGIIGFLFGYFGVPITLLAVMISVTVSYGILAGSISAAALSLYILIFIKMMGEPVKCKACVVMKTFAVLSVINFTLFFFTSSSNHEYNNLSVLSISFIPSLLLVVFSVVAIFYLFHRFNGRQPRFLRLILYPFRLLYRPFRLRFLNIKSYDQACYYLKYTYNYACDKYPAKRSAVNKFISMSKKIATTMQSEYETPYNMALYTSSLLVKSFDVKDYKTARKLFYNYADNLYPNVGGCDFRTNILGNSLSLAIYTKDKKIADIIFNKLLGKDFKIDDIPHNGVLFNLACYYSLYGKKEKMLETIHHAMKNGRKKNDFLEESDFEQYWKDIDFLNAIA